MGATAQQVLGERLTQQFLCGQFCDALERALATRGGYNGAHEPQTPPAPSR
jgi:hypothetical protein